MLYQFTKFLISGYIGYLLQVKAKRLVTIHTKETLLALGLRIFKWKYIDTGATTTDIRFVYVSPK